MENESIALTTERRMNPSYQLRTPVPPVLSSDTLQMCQQYKGLSGLRQLIRDQATKGIGVPKCGWRWKPSGGPNAITSQGAYGGERGPVRGGTNEEDTVVDGTQWFIDLDKAELAITNDMMKKIKRCDQLSYLSSQDADLFGFCSVTNAVIPIERDGRGAVRPRFSSPGMTCDATKILTVKEAGKCPRDTVPKEGFLTQNSLALTQTRSKEGFLGEDCSTSPLSRDCVIQAARFAGCDDGGTLVSALKEGDSSGRNGFDSALRARPSYTAYQSLVSPALSKGVLRDGSATLQMAIDSFAGLVENTHAQKEKTRLAAIDLCLKAGTYDTYDFCQEMTPTTRIDDTFFPCLQKRWKSFGGTEAGRGWPALKRRWMGRTVGEFDKDMKSWVAQLDSADVYEQTAALQELIGVSVKEGNSWRLPRASAFSRGVELISATIPRVANEPSVILGQQIYFGSEGETVPHVSSTAQEKILSGGTRTNHVFHLMITDLRPLEEKSLQFTAGFTDGFYMSINRMPFEPYGQRGSEIGIWNNSGSVRFATTPCMTVQKDSAEKPNILVAKWYLGGSAPNFAFAYNDCAQAIPAAPAQTNAKVILYEHCGFVGRSVQLGPGTYPFSKFMATGFPNDGLSSIRIPAGFTVTLFQDDIGSRSITLTQDDSCLVGKGFNDVTSALIITYNAPATKPVQAIVPAGVGGGEKLPPLAKQIMVGTRADNWWLDNAFLVQEPAAPWLQMEVCSRPDTAGREREGLVERRMVYFNCDVNFTAVTTGSADSSIPGKKSFVRFVGSSKWGTTSMYAFSGFRTLTLLLRPTAELSVGEEVNVLRHGNNSKSQDITVTMKNTSGRHEFSCTVFGSSGRTRKFLQPAFVGEWNLLVLQYIQETPVASAVSGTKAFKPVADVSFHSFSLASLQSGAALQNAWKQLIAARNTAPIGSTLFPVIEDGAIGESGAGYLILGNEPRGMVGFTGDIAWLHGFRVAMESKDMLEAEVRQTWKQYWYR